MDYVKCFFAVKYFKFSHPFQCENFEYFRTEIVMLKTIWRRNPKDTHKKNRARFPVPKHGSQNLMLVNNINQGCAM